MTATSTRPARRGRGASPRSPRSSPGLIVTRTGYDIHKDAARWSELLFRCEMAKRQLIADTVVPFAMREAYIEHGPPHSIDFMLERAWVEARWVPCSVPMFHRTVASVVPDPRVLLAPRADVAMALGAVLLTAGFGTEHRVVPGLGPGPV